MPSRVMSTLENQSRSFALADFARPGGQHRRDDLLVEAGQRVIDEFSQPGAARQVLDVGERDRRPRLVAQILPQLQADDLELHRFDILAQRLLGISLLARHLAQVVDERFGHAVVEGAAFQRGGLLDRFERSLVAHVLHAIAHAQPARHQAGVRVQLGDVVLAHDEHDP